MNAGPGERAAHEQARRAGERLFHFHGGLRLRHNKKISCETPVEKTALPQRLYVPLLQHTGMAAEPTVEQGQRVLKGEQIGCFRHLGSGCVHAPTSGTVSAIIKHPISHPSGRDGRCIVIRPDGLDEWRELKPVPDWQTASANELRQRIRSSGIVGLGGAVFPTAYKVEQASERGIHTLILNGSECEPYISCDEMLMRENPGSIVLGAQILQKAVGAERTVIAIEDQMGAVHQALSEAVRTDRPRGSEWRPPLGPGVTLSERCDSDRRGPRGDRGQTPDRADCDGHRQRGSPPPQPAGTDRHTDFQPDRPGRRL